VVLVQFPILFFQSGILAKVMAMHPLVSGLMHGLEKNHNYALALVDDLNEAQMVGQPSGKLPKPMNHPAWILSHLKTYRPIVAALVRGETFDDPLDHPFGMKSSPVADRSVYPSKLEIITELEQGRGEIEEALHSADDSAWAAEVSLARWRARWNCVAMGVPFLMLNHENMHLGQLSAWRRAMGLPPVQG
jgi:hypothetical protein